MSEYWKSTPKYWCKFCKVFVKDTPLEKKQHEATGKHQGAIQKSLRDLHKEKGKEEREKDRAKAEVARLNGLVTGKEAPQSKAATAGPSTVAKVKPHFTPAAPTRATADERRRQAEQLAAMGVAVPDEYRKDMSIASEWSTVSVTPVYNRPKTEVKDEDGEETKSDFSGSSSNRKRKVDDEDEDGPGSKTGKPRVWGTTLKSYPGSQGGDTTDFDSLLKSSNAKAAIKVEAPVKQEVLEDGTELKQEEATDQPLPVPVTAVDQVKTDEAPVVFKKRKGKR